MMASVAFCGIIVVIWLAVIISPSCCFRITVDALDEECYFDRVAEGTKMTLIFEVIEGGFLDIDIDVMKPDGTELLSKKAQSDLKVTFTAAEAGAYKYCFSNRMSTVTPKEIKFSMLVGDMDKPISDFGEYSATEKEEIQPEKLEVMIRELRAAIHGIRHEQEYMSVRDQIHFRTQDSTNFRVTLWAYFESSLIVIMAFAQVLYIKRFFEVKRMV